MKILTSLAFVIALLSSCSNTENTSLKVPEPTSLPVDVSGTYVTEWPAEFVNASGTGSMPGTVHVEIILSADSLSTDKGEYIIRRRGLQSVKQSNGQKSEKEILKADTKGVLDGDKGEITGSGAIRSLQFKNNYETFFVSGDTTHPYNKIH